MIDELEQDDVELVEDDDESVESFNTGPDKDEAEDINEQDEIAVSQKSISKSSLEVEDMPNAEAKRKEREKLEQAMQEFLSRGGKIQTLDS